MCVCVCVCVCMYISQQVVTSAKTQSFMQMQLRLHGTKLCNMLFVYDANLDPR